MWSQLFIESRLKTLEKRVGETLIISRTYDMYRQPKEQWAIFIQAELAELPYDPHHDLRDRIITQRYALGEGETLNQAITNCHKELDSEKIGEKFWHKKEEENA